MNESDVKIYIGKKDSGKTPLELKRAFDSVITNRENGNIDKAKLLGVTLAKLEPLGDGPLSLNLKESLPQKLLLQDILYQIKVLLIFAAEAVLQIGVSVPLLSTTAITSMYNTIENEAPKLYDNISGGTAFTFYYLALQKGGSDIAQNMAETFAMLCAVKNKEDFVAAGKEIWEKAVDIIEKEIEKADFKYI